MKLLISVTDEQEASEAITGGADIIDVKNPKEGALGASFPWIIRQIKEITPGNVEVSCALGDLPNLPGSVSLAALGGAMTGVNYIKVGIGAAKTKEDAVFLLQNATKAVQDYCSTVKVVAAGYADATRVDSINPSLIPEIADKANADVAMIDTAVKDGSSLFTYLNNEQIQTIVADSHNRGLLVALAGSLKKEQIFNVSTLKADIIGVRSAACTNGDRVNGRITEESVRELAGIMKQALTKAIALQ
ncbi:MAG: (5-formylfuran-3-yl)methyl phosphate synthase [Chloroflexota bacterium]